MSQPALAIPYERQSNEESTRTCGAACLSMIYRSFGEEVSQSTIWPLIAQGNLYGRIASATCLMAADAIRRGFDAVAVQARDPLRALRLCRDLGIQAILNHRLKPGSPAGHFTVFLDIDDTHVTLHDPLFGPARRLPHAELLDLWLPRVPDSEIVGNFLIGIADKPAGIPACGRCRTKLLPSIVCPRCKNPIALKPAALLACLNDRCPARSWNYVCCPSCDLTWNFTLDPPPAALAAAAPAPQTSAPSASAKAPETTAAPAASPQPSAPPSLKDSLDLPKLFAELDKFCAFVLSVPGAADHPDIKKQLDFLAGSKDQLTEAVAEEDALVKHRFDQLAAIKQKAEATREAHKKKLEELQTPLAPLVGDGLARALLKNLGFLR